MARSIVQQSGPPVSPHERMEIPSPDGSRPQSAVLVSEPGSAAGSAAPSQTDSTAPSQLSAELPSQGGSPLEERQATGAGAAADAAGVAGAAGGAEKGSQDQVTSAGDPSARRQGKTEDETEGTAGRRRGGKIGGKSEAASERGSQAASGVGSAATSSAPSRGETQTPGCGGGGVKTLGMKSKVFSSAKAAMAPSRMGSAEASPEQSPRTAGKEKKGKKSKKDKAESGKGCSAGASGASSATSSKAPSRSLSRQGSTRDMRNLLDGSSHCLCLCLSLSFCQRHLRC